MSEPIPTIRDGAMLTVAPGRTDQHNPMSDEVLIDRMTGRAAIQRRMTEDRQ